MRALAVACVLLAGCLVPLDAADETPAPADARLSLWFNAPRDNEFYEVHLEDQAALPVYASFGLAHPGGYTALDVLEQWRQDNDVEIEYAMAPEGGLEVRTLDGVTGSPDNGHWWALEGKGADLAACQNIDQFAVVDGTHVQLVRFEDFFRERRDPC